MHDGGGMCRRCDAAGRRWWTWVGGGSVVVDDVIGDGKGKGRRKVQENNKHKGQLVVTGGIMLSCNWSCVNRSLCATFYHLFYSKKVENCEIFCYDLFLSLKN